MPPGPEGQGAVLAMLRRSFFRAWSVAAKDEEEDIDTDELAFSLSVDHVLFIGVTSDGEDLFIELSVDGFNMISERSVDNDSLKQGLEGKGVIICCEAEKLDKRGCSQESASGEGREEGKGAGKEGEVTRSKVGGRGGLGRINGRKHQQMAEKGTDTKKGEGEGGADKHY